MNMLLRNTLIMLMPVLAWLPAAAQDALTPNTIFLKKIKPFPQENIIITRNKFK